MKFTKRIYLRYVFNGNKMDLNPLRLLQRYVEILIDIKSVTGLVICVKMQTTRQIPSSKYAVKNCKDIIRTLNGIDFLLLTHNLLHFRSNVTKAYQRHTI